MTGIGEDPLGAGREERLAAWIDGALSPEEAAAFEAELERDPELAERAADWKANDAFFASAFAPIAEQPIDAAMLERLGLGGAVAAPMVAPIAANDNPPWWRRHVAPLGGAIAASFAAILLLTPHQAGQDDGGLSLALETTPSLQTASLADGRTLEPTLTVRAKDGRWCREYLMAGAVTLACREDGRWQVEGKGEGSGPDSNSGVGLAGGADAAALDAAYDRIGASDPLGGKAEADLIAGGWK